MKSRLFIIFPSIFLTASIVIMALRPPVEPLTAAPGYQLAFVNFGPINMDIFMADADGNNPKPLLPHPAHDYNASFSADGKWIVFTSERNGSADLYRVHPDASGLQQLTNDPAFDDQAALSPDGKTLAFVSTRSGQADIYTMNIASKKVTNITNHPAGDFRPSWSPDGQWIAFSSDRDSKKQLFNFALLHSTEIYIMRSDGSDTARITQDNAFAGSPSWSADGKQLLFYQAFMPSVRTMIGSDRKGQTQLAVYDIATKAKKVLTTDSSEKLYPQWQANGNIVYASRGANAGIEHLYGKSGARGDFQHPSWSRDGRSLVFDSEVDNNWPPLSSINSRDPAFHLLRSGVFPCFSPNGKQLVCNDQRLAIKHNKVLLMDADGKNRSILFEHPTKSILSPVWSPDGNKLAIGIGQFFQSVKGPASADVAIINKDGAGLQILTDGKGNYGFPSWSPDSKQLVYRASTDSLRGLLIMDIESKKVTTLTNHTQDNFPCWSPDGQWIAFTSKRENNYDIYIIHPDGTGLKRITNTPGNDAHCVWSPDSKWIAFSTSVGGFKDEAVLHIYNPQAYGEICVVSADGAVVKVLTDNQFEEGTPAWMPLK
jgi:TolB protein